MLSRNLKLSTYTQVLLYKNGRPKKLAVVETVLDIDVESVADSFVEDRRGERQRKYEPGISVLKLF